MLLAVSQIPLRSDRLKAQTSKAGSLAPPRAGDAWVHLLAKLMVSSEEVAATLISREPSSEHGLNSQQGPGRGIHLGLCMHLRHGLRACETPGRLVAARSQSYARRPCLNQLPPPLPRCAAAMTGLLSRMDSVGPAGKAAHKLAQQMSRALSASQPGSPAAAVAGSRGQLARFNSLLSAASAASSAANSAATSPRQGPPLTARQLSRFAGASSSARGGPAPPAAAATSAAAEAAGGANGAPAHAKQRPENSAGDASPTAATVGGGQLSRMTSFGSVLLGQAAAESGSVTGPQGAGRAAAAGGLDAAAWARSFQQSQQVCGGVYTCVGIFAACMSSAGQRAPLGWAPGHWLASQSYEPSGPAGHAQRHVFSTRPAIAPNARATRVVFTCRHRWIC